MSNPEEVHKAAHMLPDGPFDENDLAHLLQALFYIVKALPDKYKPHLNAAGPYEFAWDQIHDRRAVG